MQRSGAHQSGDRQWRMRLTLAVQDATDAQTDSAADRTHRGGGRRDKARRVQVLIASFIGTQSLSDMRIAASMVPVRGLSVTDVATECLRTWRPKHCDPKYAAYVFIYF